jgi:hypothetical protein
MQYLKVFISIRIDKSKRNYEPHQGAVKIAATPLRELEEKGGNENLLFC